MDLLRIFFSFFSQFSIIQRIAHLRVLMSFTDGSLGDEQLDGFSNVVTNSSGAVIGGSCGGFFFVCVMIYIFYRLLREDSHVHPSPCWSLYLRVCATYMQILNHLLTDQTNNYLTESVSHRQTDWLTEWLTDWLTDWLTERQTDEFTDWLTDWHTDWQTDWP